MVAPPNTTLFVQNLNDKVKKEELRRTLYSLFSLYGKVIDVVATRAPKMRGTAFVVFKDLQGSTAALRGLDGEGFFGKQLKISYGESPSHATIALQQGPEAVYAIKAGLKTAAEKSIANAKVTVSGAQKKAFEDTKRKRAGENVEEEEDSEDDEDGEPEKKKSKGKQVEDDDAMEEESDDEAPEPAQAKLGANTVIEAGSGETPNSILFCENLPSEVSNDMLSPLFQQYPGFSTLKLLPIPAGEATGHAFVQYETVAQAGTAKEALDGFMLSKGGEAMKVSWSKLR